MVIHEIASADLIVMGLFTAILLPLMRHNWTLGRLKGAFLLVGYGAYVAYLYFDRVLPAAA